MMPGARYSCMERECVPEDDVDDAEDKNYSVAESDLWRYVCFLTRFLLGSLLCWCVTFGFGF